MNVETEWNMMPLSFQLIHTLDYLSLCSAGKSHVYQFMSGLTAGMSSGINGIMGLPQHKAMFHIAISTGEIV